jgi:hypothetical protein
MAPSEFFCPRLIRLHDSIIEANGEQHSLASLPFFFKAIGAVQVDAAQVDVGQICAAQAAPPM